MKYERAAVKGGAYARYLPSCLCANDVPLELVVQTFANETIHYLLGCTGCGKLGRLYIAHDLVSAASKATAKPYSAS